MLQADTIRLLFTYLIATITIVGGGVFLLITRNDPPSPNGGLIVGAAISVVTLAVQFVFTKETQNSTSRQSERSFAAGAMAATNPPPATPPSA